MEEDEAGFVDAPGTLGWLAPPSWSLLDAARVIFDHPKVLGVAGADPVPEGTKESVSDAGCGGGIFAAYGVKCRTFELTLGARAPSGEPSPRRGMCSLAAASCAASCAAI